jgi:hypothetical protein
MLQYTQPTSAPITSSGIDSRNTQECGEYHGRRSLRRTGGLVVALLMPIPTIVRLSGALFAPSTRQYRSAR